MPVAFSPRICPSVIRNIAAVITKDKERIRVPSFVRVEAHLVPLRIQKKRVIALFTLIVNPRFAS